MTDVKRKKLSSLRQSNYFTYRQLNIKKFYIPSTQSISVRFRRSKKNQQFFPYTELTDWFP